MDQSISVGCLVPRAAAVAYLLSLAACGGQGLTQTGFLDNYDRMQPQPDHTRDAIYVKPGLMASNYAKVIVEPVAWVPAPDTPVRDEDTKATLQGNLRDALTKSLGERFTVIEDPGAGRDPGPGVLRVRSAITNTRRGLWWVNVPAQAAQIAVGTVGLLRPSAGGASEEIDVRDASTGEQLVAIATYNNGLPYNISGSYLEYGHARRAFRIAAELTRDQIIQGGPAPAAVSDAVGPAPAQHRPAVAARTRHLSMSDILRSTIHVLTGSLLIITTLLYALIWLSDWFEFDIPLGLVWPVMVVLPIASALGVLVRAAWRKARRAERFVRMGCAQ